MKKKISKIFREYQLESSFIFWFSAINLTCFAFEYFTVSSDINVLVAVVEAVIVVFTAILAATYLRILFGKGKLNYTAKCIILFMTVIMSILDLFSFSYYQCRFDSGMLNAVFETNGAEAVEFFTAYVIQAKFFVNVLIAVICILVLRWLLSKITPKIFLAIAIIAPLSGIFAVFQDFALIQFFTPYRFPVMVFEVLRENYLLDKAMTQARREVTLTRNDSTIPYFVFILGESTTRKNMSLYGYTLPTTPKLIGRKEHDNLYVFTDVTSPHAGTSPVMEKLFTFYSLEKQAKNPNTAWYTYTSLFNILRQAGYKTIWLSNQEPFGVWGRPGRLYSAQVDVSRFTLVRSSRTTFSSEIKSYDEKLLPLIDEELTQSTGKNFYVIHLMGTHIDYSKRYPAEFAKFTAHDEEGLSRLADTSEIKRQIRAEYDNAVLYNDFIVDEIIKRFENKNAIIIYISDHGQEVFDTIDFRGHIEGDNQTKAMIEIPMLIWVSPEFRGRYPEICRKIADGVNKKFVTDEIIHVILGIMNIETEDYDSSKGAFTNE